MSALLLFVGPATMALAQHAGHGDVPPPKEQLAVEEEVPAVEIPPDKQQLIGLKTAVISPKAMKKIIRTVGRIEYDERKQATVSTKFEGWIEKLHADYTGRSVKKGDPLAEIYSPELYSTQQEFLAVLKGKERQAPASGDIGRMYAGDSDALIEAARQRLRLMDISDDQIRQIEETGKAFRTLTLVSPVDGTVIQKTAVLGMRVMPGEKLFDIADLSTVWVIADIYENELSLVGPGATARITLSSLPGREFTAPLEFVYPALAGDARTVKARFSILNPGAKLKPQMFTNVEIRVDLGRRLAVPDDAVLDTGRRQIVYVDKGEGYFEPREVRLGLRAEGYREVLSGLKAGEKVARSATFLIDSEAQLKGIR